MKKSKLLSLSLISSGFVMVIAFQNCSKVGFTESASLALKSDDGRDPGFDPTLDPDRDPGLDPSIDDPDRDPGKDPSIGGRDPGEDLGKCDDDDKDDNDIKQDSDWLYIPGGRGHVPMSSVAICPAGSKDAGKQTCPVFCYKGVDYVMHKSLARDYFAKKFDELPNYGGGAVPGTCANPDLKLKK